MSRVRFTTENKLCVLSSGYRSSFSSTPLRKQEQLEHRAMVVAPQGQVREEIRLVNSLDYE